MHVQRACTPLRKHPPLRPTFRSSGCCLVSSERKQTQRKKKKKLYSRRNLSVSSLQTDETRGEGGAAAWQQFYGRVAVNSTITSHHTVVGMNATRRGLLHGSPFFKGEKCPKQISNTPSPHPPQESNGQTHATNYFQPLPDWIK